MIRRRRPPGRGTTDAPEIRRRTRQYKLTDAERPLLPGHRSAQRLTIRRVDSISRSAVTRTRVAWERARSGGLRRLTESAYYPYIVAAQLEIRPGPSFVSTLRVKRQTPPPMGNLPT